MTKFNLNFQWKRKTGQFQQGEYLYVNRIKLGGYGWNSFRSRQEAETDDSTRYAGSINLPSLSGNSKNVYGATPDEVKTKIEKIVINWFVEALKEG